MPLRNQTKELAESILGTHAEDKQLAHAYLFGGADVPLEENSTEKLEFLLGWIASLEGQSEGFTLDEGPWKNRILTGSHPDVSIVGKDLSERSIKIETVRELVGWSYRKPQENQYKFGIILGVERMTEPAANAFLKTLEEPSESTHFLLLTDNPSHLLDTIRSRCFHIRIPCRKKLDYEDVASLPTQVALKTVLEDYPKLDRQALKEHLIGLAEVFSKASKSSSADESLVKKCLKTLDLIYETRLHLDSNVNQKLLVTRLVMHLRKIYPQQRTVPV